MNNIKEIVLNITDSCNLRCDYCWESTMVKHSAIGNTTIVNALQTLADSSYSGRKSLQIFGGEPTLYPEKLNFLASMLETKFSRLDVKVMLISNLFNLTDELENVISKLNNLTKFKIFVSIDGSETTHDLHRVDAFGNGTFSKVINNVERLRRRIPTLWIGRHTVITNEILNDIESVSKSMSDNDYLFDDTTLGLVCSDCNTSDIKKYDILLNVSSIKHFYIYHREHPNDMTAKLHKRLFNFDSSTKHQTCIAGCGSCSVKSNGEIFPCVKYYLKENQYSLKINLNDKPIDYDDLKVWDKYKTTNLDKTFKNIVNTENASCEQCPAKTGCDICTAFNETQNNDPLIQSEFSCLTTLRRYSVFLECVIPDLEKAIASSKQINYSKLHNIERGVKLVGNIRGNND